MPPKTEIYKEYIIGEFNLYIFFIIVGIYCKLIKSDHDWEHNDIMIIYCYANIAGRAVRVHSYACVLSRARSLSIYVYVYIFKFTSLLKEVSENKAKQKEEKNKIRKKS